MDVDQAVDVLKQARDLRRPSRAEMQTGGWAPADPDARRHHAVGVGLLWCGECDQLVTATQPHQQWAPAPERVVYACRTAGCEAILVRAATVDRQLQEFVVRRWSDPSFQLDQGRAAVAELDGQIAGLRAVHDYCSDPEHRGELARRLGGRRLFRVDERALRSALERLVDHATGLALARAMLAAALSDRPWQVVPGRFSELLNLDVDHAMLTLPDAYDDQVTEKYGGRKQRAAKLVTVEERLWELVGETDLPDAPRAGLPTEDDALTTDWGGSVVAMGGRRRAYLVRAAEGHHLTLVPPGPVLRV